MLEKREIQWNTIGIHEKKINQKLVHNSDLSRIVLSNYNPVKTMQESCSSPFHQHHHQLLQYLQERNGHQQWHSHYTPAYSYSSSYLHSQFGFKQERSDVKNLDIKTELRSKEEEETMVEKNRGTSIKSSSPEERGGDWERQRRLFELHPNMTALKGGITTATPSIEGRGVVEQRQQQRRWRCCRRQTCHSRERRAHDKSDKKMNQAKEVDIKVVDDDADDDDIDVIFDEDDNKKMLKCKLTISRDDDDDDDDSNNSSINDGNCSLSSRSINDSVCSGDDEDVDSGIDGGHSNNIKIDRRKGLRMIDLSSTQIPTDESAKLLQTNLTRENRQIKEDIDTDYKYEIISETGRELCPPSECGLYYQHRRSRSPSSRQQQVQVDKLSAILTNQNINSPPDFTRKFTNFFIDDILKPEFGKRPFETGTTTICTVERKLKSPLSPSPFSAVSSSSFPFSISSLSQSSLLSSPSFVSITSHHSSVSSGKKKAFSRYASSNHPRKSPSVEDPPRSLLVQSVNNKSNSPRGTAKKKDLTTTDTPDDPKSNETNSSEFQFKYPAWVFCTRYSDRPSSGPRSRKIKRKDKKADEKRPRTAFTPEQLQRLKREFDHGRYLTEERRQALAKELGLNESQIKIWFQNKRAKMKKVSGTKNPLALQLIAEGLYNHQTNKDSP